MQFTTTTLLTCALALTASCAPVLEGVEGYLVRVAKTAATAEEAVVPKAGAVVAKAASPAAHVQQVAPAVKEEKVFFSLEDLAEERAAEEARIAWTAGA